MCVFFGGWDDNSLGDSGSDAQFLLRTRFHRFKSTRFETLFCVWGGDVDDVCLAIDAGKTATDLSGGPSLCTTFYVTLGALRRKESGDDHRT